MTVAVSQEYPTIDGIAPSWADITTTINVLGGESLKDIDYSAIKTGSTLEIGEQKGASGGRVIKRTSGDRKDTASATYYMSGFRRLLKALMAVAPTRGDQVLIGLVHFNILAQFTPPGETEIYEVVVKGARLTKWDMGAAEGTDAQKIEIEFSTVEVAWKIDGKEVVLA